MRIRSFIIAYALVLAILLFADRRPGSTQQDRYSHVVDLTDGQTATPAQARPSPESRTRIIAPGALIPGTWAAGQIPPERLVAPLVVMDLNAAREGSPADFSRRYRRVGIAPRHDSARSRGRHPPRRRVTMVCPQRRLTASFPSPATRRVPHRRSLHHRLCRRDARELDLRPHAGAPTRPSRKLCGGRSRALHLVACDGLARHRGPGKRQRSRARPRSASSPWCDSRWSLVGGRSRVVYPSLFLHLASLRNHLRISEEHSCLTRAIRSENSPTLARLPPNRSNSA